MADCGKTELNRCFRGRGAWIAVAVIVTVAIVGGMGVLFAMVSGAFGQMPQ